MAVAWRWVVGLVAVAALFAGGSWFLVRQADHATESPAAAQSAAIAPGDPDLARNQPFPGPDPSLPEDAQHAVTMAAGLARAGAETKVAEVKRTTYESVVWLDGPFRFLAHPPPYGLTPLPEPDSILYVIDAETFVSQQSFAPWPLPRTIADANCPPE